MNTMASSRFGQIMRIFACAFALLFAASAALGAPHAAHVMDARTGETLIEENAHTPLHPASLTKMLTLYIAFEEIQRGNLTLDSMITVSKNAAAQPPSRLGLKAGQKIQLRFLIRAAAIRSANDAAQAIGDAIGGSQADFAKRMTRTAKSLGMNNSVFKNASGLTAKGHLSTAYDMSVLGRRLFYDFPQYYNIFSRRQSSAGIAEVANTNRRFLDAYKGADGIKTGFTQAAGFNLTASAERGKVRLIATVFGGDSTADRNAKVAKLLDRGFGMAKGNVKTNPPPPVAYQGGDNELLANAAPADGLPEGGEGSAAKTVRVVMTVKSSPIPMPRPDFSEMADVAGELVASMADSIAGALAEATGLPPDSVQLAAPPPALNAAPLPFAVVDASAPLAGAQRRAAPPPRPAALAGADTLAPQPAVMSAPAPESQMAALMPPPQPSPQPNIQPNIQPDPQISAPQPAPDTAPARSAPIYDDQTILQVASATMPSPSIAQGEVVTRLSTSGGKHWGVNVGRFKSSDAAERVLVKMQLVESAVLGEGLRNVTQKGGGFDANFFGLSQEAAELACRRLTARAITCIPLGP